MRGATSSRSTPRRSSTCTGRYNIIKGKGVRVGVSLNPSTPLACVEEILPDIDLLLIMTVNPGFGGQKFISGMLPKIRKARELAQTRGLKMAIEVDGGVTAENIGTLAEAGADIFVAGAAIFGSPSYSETINRMKAILGGVK